jgi:hypothetical protein
VATPPTDSGQHRPLGIAALTVFCILAAAIPLTSAVSLLWPGGPLEPMWKLNAPARPAFASMGPWAFVLLGTVSVWSAFTAIALWKRKEWGRRLAMVGLALNAFGDLTNAIVRRDPRTLVGVPIVALLLAYLASRRVRRYFAGRA